MPSKKSRRKQQQSLPITLDKALQQEILGVLLIAMGAVTALALLSITKGALSEAWVMLLRLIFGWGVYLVALVLIGGGLLPRASAQTKVRRRGQLQLSLPAPPLG